MEFHFLDISIWLLFAVDQSDLLDMSNLQYDIRNYQTILRLSVGRATCHFGHIS